MKVGVLLCAIAVSLVACDSGEPEATAQPTECDAAGFAPTYLPWEEEPVPEPEMFTAQLNNIQQWTTPANAKTVVQVALVRRYRPWEDNKEFPKVPVRGTEGRLVWIGDPGVGQLSLQWSEGEEVCDNYGLYLTMPAVSQRKAEAEMARISRSLR